MNILKTKLQKSIFINKNGIVLTVVILLFGFINTVHAQDEVDPSTLNNKIMAGYQGWFGAPNDGSGHGWIHWSRGGTPNPDNITFDMWPDLREYEEDELFPTSFFYQDGTNAGLYSSYTAKTVDRHVKWMKDYGIDGVFVQRFISSALSRREQRDKVLNNVRLGAENHGRVFANMYDMSGGKPGSFVQDVINDWKHLVDDLKITESPNYLHHNGRPVLSLWGVHVGNSGSDLSAAKWLELVTWLTKDAPAKYQVTLKAGVGNGWRNDSKDWQAVYDAFDFISPWSVGRYRDNNSADSYRDQYFQADLDETASRDMEYIPVVFPGFSWVNLKGDGNSLNSIPRNGGEFLWHQMYNAIDAGCNMVYVAMFDEVDEGTAIYKVTENESQIPTTGTFLTLDADGTELPSDWYLRLTGEASKMLRGEINLTAEIPISPYPNTSKFISQDITTFINPGASVTVSVSMQNTGTTNWTKAEGYQLGSIDPVDNMTWGVNRVDLEEDETIAPGESKTFTFDITAPVEKNIYHFQWKMMQEGNASFGEKTTNRLINVGSPSYFLDDCDALTAWSTSGLSLNSADKKQGDYCIEFKGQGTDEFRKVFSTPYNSGISAYDAVLQFWYYTSDASKMGSSNQVELGSGKTHDKDEYSWSLTGLTTGWNLITLRISEASKEGSPDLNAIDWFRLYNVKSGTVTTRIDEIQILDFNASVPRYKVVVNSGSGNGDYTEKSKVNIVAEQARDGYLFKEWVINSGSAIIVDKNASNTTLIVSSSDVEVTATYKLLGLYLDDCDALNGWGSSSVIALNGEDNKEGVNCIEFKGKGTDEFKKSFSSSYNSGVSAENAVLQFWYYISDVSLMGTNNQVELGSAGKPDQNEYTWTLSGMSDGWNLVNLKVSEASMTNGAADLNALNWFRYYNFKSGDVISRIDAIEIVDLNAGDKYILTVNKGSGTGAFYANSEIKISADNPPSGHVFDTWVINSGTPSIADVNSASTTLIMSSHDADVTATYREKVVSVANFASEGQSVKIYPNPLKGNLLYVDLNGFEKSEPITISITNLQGQTVYCQAIENRKNIVVDTKDLLVKSIYVVSVRSKESIAFTKFIVQ